MKKSIFLALAVCFLTFANNADAQFRMRMGVGMRVPMHGARRMPLTPEQRTEREVQQLRYDLNLSRDQENQLRGLLQQRDRARYSSDTAALKGLHFNEQLKQIFTQDQYGRYLAMKQKRNPQPTPVEKPSPPPARAQEPDDVYQHP